MRLSLLASEVMGGMIRHVTVMGTITRTVCAPPQAAIETTVLGPALLEGMVDVVMVVLVVVTALSMEIMAVMVVAAEAQDVEEEEVEMTIVSEARTIDIVGVIVLIVKSSKHCLPQVQSTLSMIAHYCPITSKVSLPAASCLQIAPVLMLQIVLSRTLFVGGVT